ncbi:redox-sensing transcriptional repressor Rex [Sporomusa termitida]|uniref:Redox-sensing transcriptional repressor Rex n=1 Tax=Sporomusa termitida TaxID=2377 RepID=A0A517DUY5_9FIRM|nr:redox-sensing transcriptional repressor Rex [Sporomusa termitida]QDR81165.1 Redox-sensing transcriptional repressor Rex [Sporomusa termitida]
MRFAKNEIPKSTINRIAKYYAILLQLRSEDKIICTSEDLGRRMSVPSSLVRKDLGNFGEFGTKGVGYRVHYMIWRIEQILGYRAAWNAVIIGSCMPALTLLTASSIFPPGIHIAAVCDLEKDNPGVPVGGGSELATESFANINAIVQQRNIIMGIMAVEQSKSQQVANKLVEAGVTGIANLSSIPVLVPKHILLVEVNIASWLSQITYSLNGIIKNDFLAGKPYIESFS